MSSLLEQSKELTAGIMTEDVPQLREAVTQAVTNKEGRQSAFVEIWETFKGIWTKIKDSGIISAVVEKVKTIIQKLLGRSNASGEGAPLLPTSDGDRGLLANLPNAPQSLIARAGDFIDTLPNVITDKLPPALHEALDKGTDDTKSADTSAPATNVVAAAAGVAALAAGASEKLPEAADPELDVDFVDAAVSDVEPEPEAVVEVITDKVETLVPDTEASVVSDAVPESEAAVEAIADKIETVVPDTEGSAVSDAMLESKAAVEAAADKIETVVPDTEAIAEAVSDTVEDAVPEDAVKTVTETAPEPEAVVEANIDSVPKLDADAIAPVAAEFEMQGNE